MARIVLSRDALKLVVRLLDAPVQFIPFLLQFLQQSA
jgi:hypothetical protein